MPTLCTQPGGALYAAARRHPYLLLAAACLLAGALFSSQAAHLLTAEGLLLVCAGLALAALAAARRWRGLATLSRLRVMAGFALAPLTLALLGASAQPVLFLLLAAMLALAAWLVWHHLCKTLQLRHLIAVLLALSFCLHLAYVLATPYHMRQHDLGQTGGVHGHLPYIEYLAENGFRLPDFSPADRVSFYNPPLHHLIAAAWLKLNTFFTADYLVVLERLQLLSLFYAGWATLAGCRLMRVLGLRGRALLAAVAIVCLHPTMTILSGSINNDVLCLALTMQAALLALQWHRAPGMARIVKLALCIGLAMFTKSSGALVAPAVALVFIARLARDRRTPGAAKGFIRQFAVFAALCIPIGMGWHVYNYLRFGLPFFYVPGLALDSGQYLGDVPAQRRLFSLESIQFTHVFHAWGEPYLEYNIPVAALKTSVFGEFSYGDRPLIYPAGALLFYSNIAMAALATVGMAWTLIRRAAARRKLQQAFLAFFWLTLLASYVAFCFQYPHACTMNYRYIVPTLFIGAAFIGLWLQDLGQKDTLARKIAGEAILTVTTVFCLCALFFYTLVTYLI